MHMNYFDAHTHPHFAAFKDDYRDTIRRALDAGVGMILVGTQKDTSRRSVDVAHEFEEEPVYATVGLHPVHTAKSYHDEHELGGGAAAEAFTSRGEEFDYEYYKQLAEDPKIVAIGECGLDYYRMEQGADRELQISKQKSAFTQQIELAIEVQKPLMIHCRETPSLSRGRNAFSDLIEMLQPTTYNLQPSVVHFFTGSLDDARALLDLGFSFTFGGVTTFPPKAGRHAGDYDEVIQMIPLDRILSETDAPYVAPVPYRGKRNEPAYVIEVIKKLAEIKKIGVEEMAGQIIRNARRIFLIRG